MPADVHFVVGHDITRIFFRSTGSVEAVTAPEPGGHGSSARPSTSSMCGDVAKDHYQPQVSQDARVKRAYAPTNSVLFGAQVATRPLVHGPLRWFRVLPYDDKTKMTLSDLGS